MSRQRYFQINTDVHPDRNTLDNAWDKLDPYDQQIINRLEGSLAGSVKNEVGGTLTGLGHVGLMELLCKLALFEKSAIGRHPQKGVLARKDVALEAMERVDA